jgi:hypothetical protein
VRLGDAVELERARHDVPLAVLLGVEERVGNRDRNLVPKLGERRESA